LATDKNNMKKKEKIKILTINLLKSLTVNYNLKIDNLQLKKELKEQKKFTKELRGRYIESQRELIYLTK